jgi:AAA domain
MVGAMGIPTLIIVSGPGGSGKTTLAHQLAATLGCPALCRDEIKEGMVASHPGFVPAPSDHLTKRTYHLFFEAIALFLTAEVTLVAEAAFQHRLWWQGLEPLTDLANAEDRTMSGANRADPPACADPNGCRADSRCPRRYQALLGTAELRLHPPRRTNPRRRHF